MLRAVEGNGPYLFRTLKFGTSLQAVGAVAPNRPFSDTAAMLGARKSLQHNPPVFVSAASWFFITICCQQRGRNQLCLPYAAAQLLNDAAFYHQHRKWWLHTFLLMPDHLHMIAAFAPGQIMAEAIRNWKRLTARQAGVVWQRNFFDHRLRSKDELQHKTDYIAQNPVRRGLIAHADDWPHFVDYRTLKGR
jgi:putative transposase